jgi:hypothetical protein
MCQKCYENGRYRESLSPMMKKLYDFTWGVIVPCLPGIILFGIYEYKITAGFTKHLWHLCLFIVVCFLWVSFMRGMMEKSRSSSW